MSSSSDEALPTPTSTDGHPPATLNRGLGNSEQFQQFLTRNLQQLAQGGSTGIFGSHPKQISTHPTGRMMAPPVIPNQTSFNAVGAFHGEQCLTPPFNSTRGPIRQAPSSVQSISDNEDSYKSGQDALSDVGPTRTKTSTAATSEASEVAQLRAEIARLHAEKAAINAGNLNQAGYGMIRPHVPSIVVPKQGGSRTVQPTHMLPQSAGSSGFHFGPSTWDVPASASSIGVRSARSVEQPPHSPAYWTPSGLLPGWVTPSNTSLSAGSQRAIMGTNPAEVSVTSQPRLMSASSAMIASQDRSSTGNTAKYGQIEPQTRFVSSAPFSAAMARPIGSTLPSPAIQQDGPGSLTRRVGMHVAQSLPIGQNFGISPSKQGQPRPMRPIGTPLSPTAAEFRLPEPSSATWNTQVPVRISSNQPMAMVIDNAAFRVLDPRISTDWKTMIDKIICNNDQQASIFLQQKVRQGTEEQKHMIIEATIFRCYPLMVNRFGNFLVQRCLEHGTAEQIIAITNTIRGHTSILSQDAFACHVVQKAFECAPESYKTLMIQELLQHVKETVVQRYSCHVWQKLFELRWEGPAPQIMKYVNQALRGMWHEVALGETGSLVVQNVFENCLEEDKRQAVTEVLNNIDVVARGQFGNWCIQHICEHGTPQDRSRALEHIIANAIFYSMDQFASKVVEKCLKNGGSPFLERYLEQVCKGQPNRPRVPLIDIASDQYGNYLIQWILTSASFHHRELVSSHVRRHLVSLRGSKYGARVGMLCSGPTPQAAVNARPATMGPLGPIAPIGPIGHIGPLVPIGTIGPMIPPRRMMPNNGNVGPSPHM